MTLKIAVPNKGRLSEDALRLFSDAGLNVQSGHDRRLYAHALDGAVTLLFVRAGDIPEFVQDRVVDLGVTGLDIIDETGKDVQRVKDLRFGGCRLVLAAPEGAAVKTAADVPDGARIATSFPRVTRSFFARIGKRVDVVEVSGAAEVTPRLGVADFITDLVSTGSTLAINHLAEVETMLRSSAWLIGNKAALEGDRAEEIQRLVDALDSVVAARGKRYLMANVPRDRLEEVKAVLPGLNGPTIMDLLDRDRGLVAAHAVVNESDLYRVVNELKALGATGILVLPIERLMP